ncbi:MAG: hypothetical protein U0U70_01735 [Chitinophagaceae bacterium]
MATRLLQLELLENNLFIEVEAEETLTFSTLILKLRSDEYLRTDVNYFIKTLSGSTVKENSSVGNYRSANYVITENPDWKSPAMRNGKLAEVPEIAAEMILSDNRYWVLPFFNGTSWDNADLQTQLFCIDGITTYTGKKMSLNVVTQYTMNDATLLGSKKTGERTSKMRQIIEDALNIELKVNNITENDFYSNIETLSEKLKYYLTSHLESHWGTKIHTVSIASFREYAAV